MFSDADLLGVPLRVIVSPRNNKENVCEFTARDKSFAVKLPLDNCVDDIKAKITEMLAF